MAVNQIAVVVGTGVSIGSSGGNPVASWIGLLEDGIDRCARLKQLGSEWIDLRSTDLQSGDLVDLLSVAEQVATRLGAPKSGDYSRWLEETVGRLQVTQPEVLEALRDLGVLLATTNYDSLIEEVTGLPAVTWRDRDRVEQVLRGDRKGVLHLHGHWDDPESVILGTVSYAEVTNDPHAPAVLQSLCLTKSLLFIGFGAGLEDPNFSSLLKWMSEAQASSGYHHFRLALNSEVTTLQAQHPEQERIVVLPYGDRHEDLAPFLRALAGETSNLDKRLSTSRTQGRPASTHNLPVARNLAFTGRDALLADLQARFADDVGAGVAGPKCIVLHGMGGVGKTQAAVEYLYRNVADYDVVWWIRAEDSTLRAADYEALGRELGTVAARSGNLSWNVGTVLRELERTARRLLLVFDNADRPADLTHYLPRIGSGHALITSRNPSWPVWSETIPVPLLTAADSVAFLHRRTGQTDSASSAALAKELGFLPLALEQAAAYINARGISLAGYLERFVTHRLRVLEKGKATEYRYTVATTWNLSLAAIAERFPGSVELMALFAYLAPEAIPLDLLSAHAEALPDPIRTIASDRLKLDDAVVALRRYSLVEVTSDHELSIHRLVQMVVRDQLSSDEQHAWSLAAVDFIVAAFPHELSDVRTWPLCNRLVAHALSALYHVESPHHIYYDGSSLRSGVGLYLFNLGQLDEARRVLERGVEVAKLVQSPDSPDLAKRLANLAMVLQAQGDLDGALERLERAVKIERRALGSMHPQLAVDLSNLGIVLMRRGNLRRAQRRLEEGLDIHVNVLGEDDSAVAIDRSNLAEVLRQRGNLDEAANQLRKALESAEKSHSVGHPTIAGRAAKLAAVEHDRGNTGVARELMGRVLAVDEQSFGPARLRFAEHLEFCAEVYRSWGDSQEAAPLLEREVTVTQEILGPDDPAIATALYKLGVVLYECNRPEEARPLLERAVAISENALGQEHSSTRQAKANLAVVTRTLQS